MPPEMSTPAHDGSGVAEPDTVPLIERMANELATCRMELARMRKNITSLLGRVGDPAFCKGCNRQIFWLTHQNGRRAPYTMEGANHFTDCPESGQFRRKANG